MKRSYNPTNLAIRISFLLAITQVGLVVLFRQQLPPEVPIFYSRPWGESQLADARWLVILPAVSFIVSLGNLAAAKLVEKKFESKTTIAAQIMIFFAPVFSFLCLYTLIRIILLVR